MSVDGRARGCSDELTTNLSAVRGISPRYASPEAFARLKLRNSTTTLEDDKMSDVYSVGVVVWELVTRMVTGRGGGRGVGWGGWARGGMIDRTI